MISYLASTSRPDILFAVYQCTQYCSAPKCSHEEAVKRISRYLKRTKDKSIYYEFDPIKGIEVYVDADFVGNWI